MYNFLRDLLTLAEKVTGNTGTIDAINMGNHLPGLDRITITGNTGEKPFELTLEVGKWTSE